MQEHFEMLSKISDSPAQRAMRQFSQTRIIADQFSKLVPNYPSVPLIKAPLISENIMANYQSKVAALFSSFEIPAIRINETLSSLNLPSNTAALAMVNLQASMMTHQVLIPNQAMEAIQNSLRDIYKNSAWVKFEQRLSESIYSDLPSTVVRPRTCYRFKRLTVKLPQGIQGRRAGTAFNVDRLISIAGLFVSFYSAIQDPELRSQVITVLTAIFAILALYGYMDSNEE